MTIDDLLPPSPLRRMPVVIEDSDDGTASYCSTTSAESDGGGGRAARVAAVVEEVGRLTVVPLPRTRAVSYEDLAGRPRSNPRTRTPRRNPSPLGPSLIRLGAGVLSKVHLYTDPSLFWLRLSANSCLHCLSR